MSPEPLQWTSWPAGGGPPSCHACGRPVTDPLTDLPDRATWTVRANRALAGCRRERRPAALLIIDLDRFKEINDTHGHPAGDAVLRAVAGLLRRSAPAGAVIGRYSGHADEFLVLVPGADLAPALSVAGRIRHGIRSLAVLARASRDTTVTITGRTASVGLAAHPGADPTCTWLQDLLLDADLALRSAKRDGRDRIGVVPAVAAGSGPR